MLSDSPYRMKEPALTPGWGLVAGLAASLLMLLAISLIRPLSGLSASDLLARIGQAVMPEKVRFRSDVRLLAGGFYALIGAMLGLLYAVSQERIPWRGLVAVGVFYGVAIWLASRVLTSLVFGFILWPALRSFAWFLGCVLYGVVLAMCAVWAGRRRPGTTAMIPID